MILISEYPPRRGQMLRLCVARNMEKGQAEGRRCSKGSGWAAQQVWQSIMADDHSQARAQRRPRSSSRLAPRGMLHFSHRFNPSSAWESYGEEQNALIANAIRSQGWEGGAVRLEFGLPFEVRWGSRATSQFMPTTPDTKMIQVNLDSGNTRVVCCHEGFGFDSSSGERYGGVLTSSTKAFHTSSFYDIYLATGRPKDLQSLAATLQEVRPDMVALHPSWASTDPSSWPDMKTILLKSARGDWTWARTKDGQAVPIQHKPAPAAHVYEWCAWIWTVCCSRSPAHSQQSSLTAPDTQVPCRRLR